jgi:hypothetical protein
MSQTNAIHNRRFVVLHRIVEAHEAGRGFPSIAELQAVCGGVKRQSMYNDLSYLVGAGWLVPDPAGRMSIAGNGAARPAQSWRPTAAGLAVCGVAVVA